MLTVRKNYPVCFFAFLITGIAAVNTWIPQQSSSTSAPRRPDGCRSSILFYLSVRPLACQAQQITIFMFLTFTRLSLPLCVRAVEAFFLTLCFSSVSLKGKVCSWQERHARKHTERKSEEGGFFHRCVLDTTVIIYKKLTQRRNVCLFISFFFSRTYAGSPFVIFTAIISVDEIKLLCHFSVSVVHSDNSCGWVWNSVPIFKLRKRQWLPVIWTKRTSPTQK